MECFKYEPIDLEEDSFRLVRLLKGKDGPIRCELFHARLHDVNDLIEYEALSYTWGDEDKQHNISFDGREMSVRNNLFLALTHLRHPYKDRILWIDAICIDQENIKERGHQVRHMASIYKKAERVLIWLGQATDATDLVLHSMQQLAIKTRQYACSSWNVSDKRWHEAWSASQPILPNNLYKSFMAQQREGLETLLRRPWFQRVWIIQEVANARSAEVLCGTKSVSARIFAISPSLLGVTPDSHCQAILDIMPGPSRNSSWWTQNRDLHTLLLKFRESKASDLRDKIYALLGISSDGQRTDSLIPNYEKSVEELVHDTLVFLLDFKAHGKSVPSLPSWTLQELLQSLDSLGNAVFIWAVKGSLHATVKNMVHREDVNMAEWSKHEENWIWKTAKQGNSVILELLLEHTGICPYSKNDGLSEPLEVDSKRLFNMLFDKGVSAYEGGNYYVDALQVALETGHKQVAELLLNHGVGVDSQDVYRNFLLSKASDQGHTLVVELLIEKGADVNVAHKTGITPLQIAVEKERKEVVSKLLEKGAIPDITNALGQPLLHFAVEKEYSDIVRLLLQNKANADIRNNLGETSLQLAVENGQFKMVGLLLDRGANPNITNNLGQTLLQVAVEKDHIAIVDLLLGNGANPLITNNSGQTLLELAVEKEHIEFINLLLEKGKESNTIYTLTQTIHQLAVKRRQFKVAYLLLGESANFLTIYHLRQTILELAIEKGRVGIVKLALEKGGSANAANYLGQTLLQIAAGQGHSDIVQVLLASGAKPGFRGSYSEVQHIAALFQELGM